MSRDDDPVVRAGREWLAEHEAQRRKIGDAEATARAEMARKEAEEDARRRAAEREHREECMPFLRRYVDFLVRNSVKPDRIRLHPRPLNPFDKEPFWRKGRQDAWPVQESYSTGQSAPRFRSDAYTEEVTYTHRRYVTKDCKIVDSVSIVLPCPGIQGMQEFVGRYLAQKGLLGQWR